MLDPMAISHHPTAIEPLVINHQSSIINEKSSPNDNPTLLIAVRPQSKKNHHTYTHMCKGIHTHVHARTHTHTLAGPNALAPTPKHTPPQPPRPPTFPTRNLTLHLSPPPPHPPTSPHTHDAQPPQPQSPPAHPHNSSSSYSNSNADGTHHHPHCGSNGDGVNGDGVVGCSGCGFPPHTPHR